MDTQAKEAGIFTSTVDFVVNWGRKNSLWPFPYGTACCAIEFMSTESSRYDLSRMGSEYVRLRHVSPMSLWFQGRSPISRLRF